MSLQLRSTRAKSFRAVPLIWKMLYSRAFHIEWFCPIHTASKKRKEIKKENGKRPLRRVSYLQGQHYDIMKEVSGGAQVLPVPLPGYRPENVKM